MGDKERINYVKSELRNLKYLQHVVLGFDNRIAEIDNQLMGVSAVDPSRATQKAGAGRINNRDAHILSLLDKKQRIINDRAAFVLRVNKINSFLDELSFEDRKAVTDVYINGYTIESVAIKQYCSEKTLRRKIDAILSSF